MRYESSGASAGASATQPHPRTGPAAQRRIRVAVAALVIPLSLVAVACGARATPTPTVSAEAPTIEPSATPGDTSLLKLSGKGDKKSENFSASGDSVDVKFDYKCSPEGSFTLNFFGAGVSPELPDVITDEFGASRSDTVNEPLNATTGPFHVEVTTAPTCEWTVTVLGSK